eukprot:COSAG01_NODE_2596_length_7401_cov_12.151055_9_plen_101_part_00
MVSQRRGAAAWLLVILPASTAGAGCCVAVWLPRGWLAAGWLPLVASGGALCGMRHEPLAITLVLAAAGGPAPTAAAAAEVNLLFLLIDDLVRRGLVLLVT